MADHTHARVVREHPRELLPRKRRAIGDGDLPGVDRTADADPTAVVDRHPCGPRRGVDKGVQQWPVGDRVRAVFHRLRLAIRARDAARIEVVAADHDGRRELTRGDHVVEALARDIPLAISKPADARR